MFNPENNEMEISIGVKLEAGVYFHIDRDEWVAMSDERKREKIADHLNAAAIFFANDRLVAGPETFFSANIYGPETHEIDLAALDIYDPIGEDESYITRLTGEEFDCNQAMSEGWGIFESTEHGWHIEKDDESNEFADDEAAINWVYAKAAMGSKYHADALAWIEDNNLPICANGIHSWADQTGKLDPDTRCTRCGERYDNPD